MIFSKLGQSMACSILLDLKLLWKVKLPIKSFSMRRNLLTLMPNKLMCSIKLLMTECPKYRLLWSMDSSMWLILWTMFSFMLGNSKFLIVNLVKF